jgi:tRNA threonylcarbamoyl adenosine modification protein (Sua5/YciO/YrdC/YwlC family)
MRSWSGARQVRPLAKPPICRINVNDSEHHLSGDERREESRRGTQECVRHENEISRAAGLLRAGRLVAFPTETVYGLGANALSEQAVRLIFEAKGRPLSSPLIVHVASIEMARELVSEWPEKAELLAQAFWPGPLTIIVPK